MTAERNRQPRGRAPLRFGAILCATGPRLTCVSERRELHFLRSNKPTTPDRLAPSPRRSDERFRPRDRRRIVKRRCVFNDEINCRKLFLGQIDGDGSMAPSSTLAGARICSKSPIDHGPTPTESPGFREVSSEASLCQFLQAAACPSPPRWRKTVGHPHESKGLNWPNDRLQCAASSSDASRMSHNVWPTYCETGKTFPPHRQKPPRYAARVNVKI